MARELGTEQNPQDVRAAFLRSFAEIFGYSEVQNLGHQSDFPAVPEGPGFEARDVH
jgi:hypothetical protein